MQIIRRSAFFAVCALTIMSLAGCANTIRGAGRDVSNTADAVGDAANDVAN